MSGIRFNNAINGELKRCFSVLSARDRRYLIYVVGIQIGIGLLDLMSLALMGTIGALAVSGVQSESPGLQVQSILNFLQIEDLRFQSQIAALAVLTTLFLVLKTLFSLYFSRRIVFYLSAKGARVSSELIRKVSNLPLSEIKRFSEQSLLFSISSGVNIVLIGVIASFCNLIADFSLLVMLSIALFVIDPIIALLSILVFGITAFGLYITTRKRALKFGQINSEMNIASNSAILNLFALYRELNVRNRKAEFTNEIAKIRSELGRAIAEVNFLPNLSKYLLEITLVVGGFLIVGVELLLQNAVNAVGALAVFLTAASRITPALLRVQQSATGIKNSIGMSLPTLNILEELQESDDQIETRGNSRRKSDSSGKGTAEILFENASFCYPDSIANAISDVSISIQKNEMVALVGPSGSGKSTLVDLLLGVLRPSKGFIEICGISNERAIRGNEFKIGYVPQSVSIIEGTLRENLTFGFKPEEFADFEIWDALGKAELSDDLKVAQITLDSRMGAGGKMLSGGQKQRLGIARALLPSPQILVMDEATSALDSETEDKLNLTIAKMKGSVTLLIIAHRLSSVMNSDRVLYLDKGKLVASGTFSEVRSAVSDFDNQAKLMGL